MFILSFGFETVMERYTARILKVIQIVYVCLDAVDINGGYNSSSSDLHVNRDASQITWGSSRHLPRQVSPHSTRTIVSYAIMLSDLVQIHLGSKSRLKHQGV